MDGTERGGGQIIEVKKRGTFDEGTEREGSTHKNLATVNIKLKKELRKSTAGGNP